MTSNQLSRRRFLQGLGTATLALPFLPSLLPRSARATALPVNFIGIAAQNGLYRMYGPNSELMPKTPEGNTGALPGLSQINGQHTVNYGSLATLAQNSGGQISKIVNSNFNSLLPKMTMLQGFDYVGMPSSEHHTGQFGNWAKVSANDSGNPNMATLDVVLASYYKQQGLPSDIVAYTAVSQDDSLCCSFNADGSPTSSRFNNPAALWDKYFGNFTTPTDFRSLLVNQVYSDYKLISGNANLGADDRQRLEAHMTLLSQTQKEVAQVAMCTAPLRPTANMSGASEGDRQLILTTMNSVIASLISCGMCNVFMGWAWTLVSSDNNDWHTWSHAGYANDSDSISDPTSYANLEQHSSDVLNTMCLDLATKLDTVGQLDNSLILCLQEHSKRGHENWNVPAILFGGASGAIKTGQYIDFRNIADRDDQMFTRYGYPMNQLYANVLMAAGMPSANFEALNQTRTDSGTTWPFRANSGYGITAINAQFNGNYEGTLAQHYANWTNYDLSSWLPQLKA